MTSKLALLVYPVRDLAAAKALHGTLLGMEPYADQPYYVGFRAGELEIGLDPRGHAQGLAGPVAYWTVEDIRTSLRQLVEAGGEVQQDARDVGGGRLIATVKDADGNVIGLMQQS